MPLQSPARLRLTPAPLKPRHEPPGDVKSYSVSY
jgi:hypothetical protein